MTLNKVFSVSIWFVTMVTVSHVTSGADPVYTPQTLSDSAGNFADNNSRITWARLPSGRPYITTAPARISEGLKPYYDLVHSFIDLVFVNGIPKDLIENLIDMKISDIMSNYNDYVSSFMGVAICTVVGFLFMLIFPIIACCFCCCRCCCGKCGGKMQQSRDDSNNKRKKFIYIGIVMISTAFVLSGTVCMFVNNNNISTMLDNIPNTAADNIADVKTFVQNAVDEAYFMLDVHYEFLKSAIFRDFDNIAYLVGKPLKDDIDDNTNLRAMFSAAYDLADGIDSFDDSLVDLENKNTAFTTVVNALEDGIDSMKSDIQNIFTHCSVLDCPTASRPNYNNVEVVVDIGEFPDLSGPRSSMNDAKGDNLTKKVEDAEKEYDDIPNRVQRDSNSTILDMKDTINDLNDTIADAREEIDRINDDVNGPSDKYDLNGWLERINDYTDMAKTYDKYRWYAGVGLSSLCILVVICTLIGLLCGVTGSSVSTPPTKRGCISNCGGIFLMAGVGVIFIFSSLLMLLTVVTFLPGAPLYKLTCDPITDLDKLEEFFTIYNDKQVGEGYYYLGDLLHGNNTIPLTLSGLLSDCKNGKAGYLSLKFDEKLDTDELFNYTDTIDVEAEIDAVVIDLSDVSIYPTGLQNQLEDVRKAVDIEFHKFYNELQNNITSRNLSELADEVDSYADTVTDATAKNDLKTQATVLRNLHAEEYVYVEGNRTSLNVSANAMDTLVKSVPGLISTLDTGLQGAEIYIRINGSEVVKGILTNYANRLLRILDSFVAYTKNLLFTDLGSCQPIWNFYNSVLVYTLCYNAMDGFNGFWFSLGWVIFFFMPTLIFSVRTAKYFRTMKEADTQALKDEAPPPYSEGKYEEAYGFTGEHPHPSIAQIWLRSNRINHRDYSDF